MFSRGKNYGSDVVIYRMGKSIKCSRKKELALKVLNTDDVVDAAPNDEKSFFHVKKQELER